MPLLFARDKFAGLGLQVVSSMSEHGRVIAIHMLAVHDEAGEIAGCIMCSLGHKA